MSTAQEAQEERHTLWVCAGVFGSPYTASFTRFFPFDIFFCFCQFNIFTVVSVCFCNDAYLYNEIIFIEINSSSKIIICLTCWFHLEWVAVDK